MEVVSDIRSKSALARVIRQFKDWETRIKQYHNESGDFRSLCEDFAVCERALEKWQASDAAIASQRQQEYTELLAELRSDILEWMEQNYTHDPSANETGSRDPHTS